MVIHKAQDISARPRTEDIQLNEDIDFKSMLLPKPILKGLNKSGYVKPSPIQRKALPLVRCGLDLIVQAKAGTGKTCVFAVAALELVQPDLPFLQAVVLAPTREIALQITEVITALGQAIEGLKTCCFIGGYPVALDQKNATGCHIAVGAPGRMRYLMEKGFLKPDHTRLFVLDEADKLMEKSFVPDINEIFSYLPESKQMLAVSATYAPEMVLFLKNYMHQAQYVTPQKCTDTTTVLIGIRQFVSVLTHHVDKLARLRLKERHLLYLLRSITFNQCLIFSNLHTRAVSICNMLRKEGWAVEWIAGRQEQTDRVIALSQLKEQRVRILVTTDLTARGIDAENVNFIINLDVPRDYQTYLHRMGRAGRFGTHGLVVTIISDEDEFVAFQKLLGAIGGTSQSVNCVPEDLKNVDLWSSADVKFKHIFGIVENAKSPAGQMNQDRTATDQILSQESSDECVKNVTNLCIEKNELVSNVCSCKLYEAGPSDIKLVSVPSLFIISKKEDHWYDVLPVVVNESQIPLNTPVALVDSKFIRVKKYSDINKTDVGYTEDMCNPIRHSDSEVKCIETNFITFEEIKSILEDESAAEINLEKNSCENFLSSQEIENFLENNVTKCEGVEEKVDCYKFDEAEKVLVKYKCKREKLENILIGFDSFDVVGWMAVDKLHNVIENILHDKLTVMEFRVVNCSSGKRHIQVLSSLSESGNGEDNFENHISTLDLDNLNLVQPFSLESIADRLKPSLQIEQTIQPSTNKYSFSSFKTDQIYNIPYPKSNGVLKNGCKIKSKITSDAGSQNCNKSKNQARIVPKETKICPKYETYFDDRLGLLKENDKIHFSKANVLSKSKDRAGDEINDSISSNEISSDLSNESDTSSSEKMFKGSSNPFPIRNQHSSISSEESGPYMNMSQNLARWQELHDCEESDSVSSTESDVIKPTSTNHIKNHLSDSTSSNVHPARNGRSPRQRRNVYPPCSSDTYDTFESGVSNHNSFRTACSQHLSSGGTKENVYIPPYSYHDLYGHSSYSACDQNHHRNFKKPSHYNSSCTQEPSLKICQTVPKASTSKGYQCYDPYQYTDVQINRKNNTDKNSSSKKQFKSHISNKKTESVTCQFSKRLTSNNLFLEWYSTWYTELRQRASHLEYIEYINMMSAP